MLPRLVVVLGVAAVHGLVFVLLFGPSPLPPSRPIPRPLTVRWVTAAPHSQPASRPRAAQAAPSAFPAAPATATETPPTSASAPPSEPAATPETTPPAEPEPYRNANQVTTPPSLPTDVLLAGIRYPEGARKRKVQGTVVLELWIDQAGTIQRVDVVTDPGWGFADAAVKALTGIVAQPAQWGDRAVAVRYRYPVRFSLK